MNYTFHELLPRSDWKCHLFGKEQHGLIYQPKQGGEPNWFHRKMQKLILGFIWEKAK